MLLVVLAERGNPCMQALLSLAKTAAVPSAMLTVAMIAGSASAQRARSAASGEAMDVRWARVHASLAPAGSPSAVADHLATTLQAGRQTSYAAADYLAANSADRCLRNGDTKVIPAGLLSPAGLTRRRKTYQMSTVQVRKTWAAVLAPRPWALRPLVPMEDR